MADTDSTALSPTRTRATWKPGVFDEPIPFYGCNGCAAVFVGVDGGEGPQLTGGGRRPTIELPYAPAPDASACAGSLARLAAADAASCADAIELSYDVVGGFDQNALRVFWKMREDGCEPRWIALKTFTGMQIKYVLPGKRPPLVFALGDEDAYAYCDEDPCVSCTFHCKRGFELYAYVERVGLVVQSVHREAVTR